MTPPPFALSPFSAFFQPLPPFGRLCLGSRWYSLVVAMNHYGAAFPRLPACTFPSTQAPPPPARLTEG
ncbi:hypothetical protein GQ53DRAFT_746689 [Thozetella sp. PMI_491]|nr:hypothetical protein GQ53DRAFT_746689 [Thozetella sp. PMI_491]